MQFQWDVYLQIQIKVSVILASLDKLIRIYVGIYSIGI